MNIDKIEEKMGFLQDRKLVDIIELIIDAVRSYPLSNLDDLEVFIEKIKTHINKSDITLQDLKLFVDNNLIVKDDEIWIIDSMTSLIEAFELMDLYKLNWNQILSIIRSMEY